MRRKGNDAHEGPPCSMSYSCIMVSDPFLPRIAGLCIILVHLMIKYKFHFLPESIAFVLIGQLMPHCVSVYSRQLWLILDSIIPFVCTQRHYKVCCAPLYYLRRKVWCLGHH